VCGVWWVGGVSEDYENKEKERKNLPVGGGD